MKKYFLLTFILVIIYVISISLCQGQTSSINDLNYMLKKLELNYPGYNNKANTNFFALIKEARNSVKKDSSQENLFFEMSRIILYFDDLHIRLKNLHPVISDTINNLNRYEVIKKYFENSKNTYNVHEGFWLSEYHDVMIGLVRRSRKEYKAYVVESKIPNKPVGTELFAMKKIGNNFFQTTYLNSENFPISISSFFVGKDTLINAVSNRWTRISNQGTMGFKNLSKFEWEASIKKINDSFLLIKIPKSDIRTKSAVDSLVKSNLAEIKKTSNLIIDIRNNTGGTWLVYNSILPFIYTNPILTSRSLFRCSDDIISDQKKYVTENAALSGSELVYERSLLDSMIKHRYAFYFEKGDTIRFDSVSSYPKKIFLFVNYKCISASELFIKFCQQSKKIKIVGERTRGESDFLEFIPYVLPSGKYELSIPRLQAFFPNNTRFINKRGISPDLTVPYDNKDWVEYIMQRYSKNAR